jgi:peptide/nickel transport system permease protein
VDHVEVQVGDASALAPAGGNVEPERRDVTPAALPLAPAAGRWARFLDGDVWHSFRSSPMAIAAAVIALICVFAAVFANLIAPHNPFDLATLELSDSMMPPAWLAGGAAKYLLGTDEQGRDMLSAILYGLRISLIVGVLGVAFSGALGILLGLVAGYVGGAVDSLIMRIADVQLTFPAILIALLVNGIAKSVLGNRLDAASMLGVLVLAIGLSFWVQYARTVRGSVLVEKNKDYVAAAQLIGLPAPVIMLRHVLPNTTGPILVIATINLALAIITEATLSFLGSGMPDTMPSLGTLIRIGNNYLFSGEWWIVAFPGIALAALILSINLLGDWLRDALNPKLR